MDTTPAVFIQDSTADRVAANMVGQKGIVAYRLFPHKLRGAMQGWKVALRDHRGQLEFLTNDAFEAAQ